MRSAFLWSLFNLASTNIKQHIVIQPPPIIHNHRFLIEDILNHNIDPYYENRKIICFSNDIPYLEQKEKTTNVPLRSIYDVRGDHFPQYHLFTRSHYLQFSRSIYASVMEYVDYCQMEDKLAHIVNEYLDDEKNNWLILMDDPFLMENIRNYGTKKSIVDHTTWITTEKTSFNDMLILDIQKDHPRI